MSVLGMTEPDEKKLDTLQYRLLAPSKDIGEEALASWGHEYMRHLALELGQDYNEQCDTGADPEGPEMKLKVDLARELVPYFLKHQSEADAVDLLSELEIIKEISHYVDDDNFERVCMYMVSMVPLLTFPDNIDFLQTAHDIYKKYGRMTQAMTLAIRLGGVDLMKDDIESTEDYALQRQMCLQIARNRVVIDHNQLNAPPEEWQELISCLCQEQMPMWYRSLGKELNILDPKTPQDIYKTHLESSRTAGITNVDSARHNLASAFVNAFVNAGFGTDKLMLVDDEDQNRTSWVWKTKDDGRLSTAASVGMLMQWDVNEGLNAITRYSESDDDHVKAGAMLAYGILLAGVREPSEPVLALLAESEVLQSKTKEVRLMGIMGLALAYANTWREDLRDQLLAIVTDSAVDIQLSAMAALALGLIFIGSSDPQITEPLLTSLFDEDRAKQLDDKWARFYALGLGLLFFGQQEEVNIICETLEAIDHRMAKSSSLLCSICAWAGTGAVLKLQDLLHTCYEHIEEDSDEAKKGDGLLQSYAVIGLGLIAMGEEVGQDMVLRQFGHLMHYGEANIRRAVPLAMGLVSPSNPQMKIYDTLSRYSHDNDNDVAVNAIFAMGLTGAGTNNARLAQLLRQLASYYSRDANSLFMVRLAQGLLHMGKGTLTVNPFHSDRQVMSHVSAGALLIVLVTLIDAKQFILGDSHWMLYFLSAAMTPRMLVTLDEEMKPLQVNVRVGQAVDVVGQAGRPKTITGWQTQSTPVLLGYGERAELEDEKYMALNATLEGVAILRKVS